MLPNMPICLICNSSTIPSGSILSTFSHNLFKFRRCTNCGFGFVENANTDYEKLYGQEYYEGRGGDPHFQLLGKSLQAKKIQNLEFVGLYRTMINISKNSGSLKILDFLGGARRPKPILN